MAVLSALLIPLAVRTVTDDGDGVGATVGDGVDDCNRLTMLKAFVAVLDILLMRLVVRAAPW